jgi:small subunit ribosomal protein S5
VGRNTVSDNSSGDLQERTVRISRVAKVVKGGRRFSFSAFVVAGDGLGRVGFGLGKASEVPDALKKASDQAKKNLIRFPITNGSIPHDIVGKFGPTKVIFKPAAPGTGVIAGSAVRAILELSGITDIRTKCIGSNSANNVLEATINGLLQLREPETVSSLRSLSLDEMSYQPY